MASASNHVGIHCAICICFLICACGPPPDVDHLARAKELCQDQKWDLAVKLLKARLQEDPEDAAAHFYLGRCYLNGHMLYPAVAEGEFSAALMLFAESGRRSPIPEYSDQYFELRCHLEIVKVYVRMLMIAKENNASPQVIQKIQNDCRQKAAQAERVMPDAPEIKELQKILGQFNGESYSM
jgi:hypothetical protein